MKGISRRSLWGILAALLSVAISFAQSSTCPELVAEALQALADNCLETGRNQACYGYDQVEASFLIDVEADFFSRPADLADLVELETIRTAPLNRSENTWGVALLNLQANLPNTIPGQNVSFILLGDVEVENAVAPDEVFEPNDGITVTLVADVNLRSGAGGNFNVLTLARTGETFLADAISEDGNWLRVASQERPAWLERAAISEDVSILPTLTSESYTPMQAFYLRTGIGQPECEDASENALIVQGPEDIEIELSVNGANVRLGSSGALRIVMIDGLPFLDVLVFDGEFEVDGVTIQQGQHSLVCLGDEDSRGLDGESNDLSVTCPPSPPEPLDPDDFNADWCVLDELPVDILHYPITDCYRTHTVANGENLYRISLFYCTTMQELIALNGISDPNQLVVGQVLFLPLVTCEGEGSTRPPNTGGTTGTGAPPPIQTPNSAGVDCTSFAISPTEIIASNFTLSWSPAIGADEYEIAVFDNSGYQVSTTRTSATSIQMNGGTSFPPSGYVDVRAYRAGAYACYTRLNFVRGADPNPVPPTVFTASIASCGSTGSDYAAVINWDNASATPVTIQSSFATWASPTTVTSNQTQGSMTIYTGFSFYSFISIKVSDGTTTINLGGC